MDFLKDTLKSIKDLFPDWPLGIISSMLLILVLVVTAWGIFTVYDSSFLPIEQDTGQIINKKFTPAHVTYIPIRNTVTKMTTLTPVNHPDRWELTIGFRGQTGDVSVTENFYNSVAKDDSVTVEYSVGRHSKNIYFKGVSQE